LTCALQANPLEMIMEHGLNLAHHMAQVRRLIVNSFMEHGELPLSISPVAVADSLLPA
jgi:transcriptional regulatory protein LevR